MTRLTSAVQAEYPLYDRFVLFAGTLTAVLGAFVCGAWLLHIDALKSVLPGLATMKFNTALCFTVIALALWVRRSRKAGLRNIVALGLCAFVFALAGATLLEYFTGWKAGIDQLAVSDMSTPAGAHPPGRMSVGTAGGFLLTSAALALSNRRFIVPAVVGQWLAVLAVTMGVAALFGYIFGVAAFYKLSIFSTMALHTALLFVIVGLGILLLHPGAGLLKAITSPHIGGQFARAAFPAMAGVLVVLGFLSLLGVHAGQYGMEFGFALVSLSGILILAALIWFGANFLNSMHRSLQEGRVERDYLASIVESSNDAIASTDLNGIVTSWNRTAERLFGYSATEMIGQPMARVIPQDIREEEQGILRRIAQGEPVRRLETARLTKAGDRKVVSLTASPILDSSGKVVGASKIARDITEQRKTEDQLRQAQKMEAVGSLTGGIAHDFNNLLTIVVLNLELILEKSEASSQIHTHASEALSGAMRGAELTRQLLAFARKQALEPHVTDINDHLSGMVRLLDRTLGDNIEIRLELAATVWPVLIDPSQLDSAIANLAVNARDAMPGGGSLLFATRNGKSDEIDWSSKPDVKVQDYVLLEVSDTGTGIPKDKIAHIFEPFFTTKDVGKGTGLGLAMVYGFVKQSGGHLTVYSEEGLGTTFRMYLPRTEAGEEAPAKIKEDSVIVTGKGETIMVIEDNPVLRATVAEQLESLGYVVIEAGSGAEAFDLLKDRDAPPDLVFSDVVMPGGVSGTDLAAHVASRWPAAKILLTSGFPRMVAEKGGEIHAEILSKPYRLIDLARRIRQVLDQ